MQDCDLVSHKQARICILMDFYYHSAHLKMDKYFLRNSCMTQTLVFFWLFVRKFCISFGVTQLCNPYCMQENLYATEYRRNLGILITLLEHKPTVNFLERPYTKSIRTMTYVDFCIKNMIFN